MRQIITVVFPEFGHQGTRVPGSDCHKVGQMLIFSKGDTFLYTAMLILTDQRLDDLA